MPSTGQPVKIGPFLGGLNTYSDPSTIGDEECQYIRNFDIDLDGTLVSRPPIIKLTPPTAGTANQRILGFYTAVNGDVYIIYTCISPTPTLFTRYYNITTGVSGTITSGLSATAMVQYADKAWLISNTATAGGSWDGTTWTPVAAIAKGVAATIYKERIYVGAADGTVYFSGAANPSSWTGTDFFKVSAGDGEDLVTIKSFSGAVVIFKTASTYLFAYDSAPTKGAVQNVSTVIGAQNANCVTEFENSLYVMYAGNVYAISNWNWEQLNVKVPFKYINGHAGFSTRNFSLSTIGNRLIVRYYDSIYVYGFKTRAWTQWASTLTPDAWFKSPVVDTVSGIDKYYASNYLTSDDTTTAPTYLFMLKDDYTAADIEAYTCEVRSKVYNFNVPYSYKRLFWWGVDLLANSIVNANVVPVSYGIPVTWNQLSTFRWSDLTLATWRAPYIIPINVTDSADIKNYTGVRMFVKYLKSLRFRQIYFVLSSTVDGSTATGPLRIFGVTAFVANKEIVTSKIS